jgi:predicted enzyme related to lactoylglutathione lyase
MSTLTQHAPGTFCWIELATTDQAGARDFYSKLFGYEVHETPTGPGSTYTIFRLGGRDAAAMHPMDAAHYPPGTPAHWMTYLAVTSADQAAAKVKESGGNVMAPPFDVMDVGRMAVCADPTGAAFCVWEGKAHAGLGVKDEPGALAWCQLNVPGTAGVKAQSFYPKAFDWTFHETPMGPGMSYTTFLGDGSARGGMMPMPPGVNAPAHWLVYFAAPNVDATADKAKSLGAQVMVPATDIPGIGRFAVIADPQGAPFAIVNFTKPM